jgi:hypothetical protein
MEDRLRIDAQFRFQIGRCALRMLAMASVMSAAMVSAQSLAPTTGKNDPLSPMTLLEQQIGIDTAAPTERNPQGLHIQFERIGEIKDENGHTSRYRMLIPGAPEKQGYVLGVWRIGVPVKTTPQQVFVNSKGLVMWHPPIGDQEGATVLDRDNEVELDLKAARGEPIRYVLASPDGKYFFPGTVVPYPVVNVNGKCRMEARLGLPLAEAVIVYVDGLAPSAIVPLQTLSEGEKHSPMLAADAKGHAAAIVEPEVANRNAGVVKISVDAPGCSVFVEMPWGAGSYQPL